MRGRKPSGSRRRKHNSRRPRFVVGGMDAHTVKDHILAEGLIDDDTLVQFPGATASPSLPGSPSNTSNKHVRGVVIETTPHDEGSLKP